MTGHTPGPWGISQTADHDGFGVTLLRAADGHRLAELFSLNRADDALIASAPDLLAALGRHCGNVQNIGRLVREWSPDLGRACDEMCADMRAVHARATGKAV